MTISITGHTGFIGSHLKMFFSEKGYTVLGIGRKELRSGNLSSLLSQTDILINLAGAPIMKRWTKKHSKALWNSRIQTTQTLVDALGQANPKPRAFFSASAVDIYANDEESHQTEEQNTLSNEFLGILCQRWEEEALRARIFCKTYITRIGVVLGNEGGALPQMKRPFNMGVGGKIASGKQKISWIHIDDFANALLFLIEKLPDKRVFNFTSPNPVTNEVFSSTLAKSLKKPNIFTVPAFALKLLYGEGSIVVLTGRHVLPKNLEDEGFVFSHPHIEQALTDILGPA